MIPEWMDQYVSMAALNITWSDVVEILILAFIIYHVMIWIKSTRAWSLMKGSAVLFALLILAYVFHMNTILWIAKNFFSLGIMAVIVVFQPELRRALEQLGENNLLTSIVPFDNSRKVEAVSYTHLDVYKRQLSRTWQCAMSFSHKIHDRSGDGSTKGICGAHCVPQQ